MIVKKMPISQGFPDIETVKKLSNQPLEPPLFRPVFYDIETTGLARNSTFLYLIGAVTYENNSWCLHQWFAEKTEEEPALLKAFSDFLLTATHTIQYNGNHFDQPYLEQKYTQYGLSSPFPQKKSLDLYLSLKPLKTLLKLPDMKQPTLEQFLGLPGRTYPDGREGIRLYRSYEKTSDAHCSRILLGHNQEDLLGLGKIFTMLSYPELLNGSYEPRQCLAEEGHVIWELSLTYALPAPFSNGCSDFYLTGEKNSLKLSVKLSDGRLKRYYPNYKDYEYLPLEDTAILKVLSQNLDRSLRKKATPQTCYTWFPCSDAFLHNPKLQKEYLVHALPVFLSFLK